MITNLSSYLAEHAKLTMADHARIHDRLLTKSIMSGILQQPSSEEPDVPPKAMTREEWLTTDQPLWMLTYCEKVGRLRTDVEVKSLYDAVLLYGRQAPTTVPREAVYHTARLAQYRGSDDTKTRVCHLIRDIIGDPFHPVVKYPSDVPRSHEKAGYYETVGYTLLMDCWLTPDVMNLADAAHAHQAFEKCRVCKGRGQSPVRKKDAWEEVKCVDCDGYGGHKSGLLESDRLMVLADAIEEAGCVGPICPTCEGKGGVSQDHPFGDTFATEYLSCCHCEGAGRLPHAVLAHLRSDAPHYRGCWTVELLRSKNEST